MSVNHLMNSVNNFRSVQFDRKRLLLASMLIAIGLPGVMMSPFSNSSPDLYFWLWFASFCSMGTGVGTPFQRKKIGSAIGLCIGIAIYAYLFDAQL